MKNSSAVTCLFLDIGGVLLTNGWDHLARRRAMRMFKLNWDEMETRHHLIFESYEKGMLTLEEYLRQVVFYKDRTFSPAQFRKFMFAQSKPYTSMLELVKKLKSMYGLKIIVVSNEARELNKYRISRFKLDIFVDAFISSCFVQIRKPDPKIFKLALNIANVEAHHVVFIENTLEFVKVAKRLGIRSILHHEFSSTQSKLASFGLKQSAGDIHASV